MYPVNFFCKVCKCLRHHKNKQFMFFKVYSMLKHMNRQYNSVKYVPSLLFKI